MLLSAFFWCIKSYLQKPSLFHILSTSAIAFIKCRNRHHIKNHIKYKANINNTSIFLMGTLAFLFMWLNKTPSDGTYLGEPPGGFCDVGCCCCCFPHWRFLRFRATFLCHRHSTLASQVCEGLHQLWALPWLLSVALLLPGFSVTVLPRALRFWVGVFYPRAFFTLTLLTDIFGTFLWLRCGQEHTIQDLPLCLPSQSCLFRLTHGLELLIL